MTTKPRICIPLIDRVALTRFSLYEQAPEIELDLTSAVFCLVGANGLGKSTLLATIGFGLTGVVADPERKFESLNEYYNESIISSSRDYFTGRVSPLDRDDASVALEFKLGTSVYKLRRGMFDPTRLRELRIVRDGVNVVDEVLVEGGIDESREEELHRRYVGEFLQDSGLASFEQFVFLHYFLMTFDERRHLLFWDPEVARQAIYLSFGIDPTMASEADAWQRQADRHDSQARQAQYQATQAVQRMRELTGIDDSDQAVDPDLLERHEELEKRLQVAEQRVSEAGRTAEDAQLAFSLAASENYKLIRDYERIFSEDVLAPSGARAHPLIRRLIEEGLCGICGSSNGESSEVERRLNLGECPLCSSSLDVDAGSGGEDRFARLEELDKQIQTSRLQLDALERQAEAERSSAVTTRQAYESASSSLQEFEQLNQKVVAARAAQDSGVAGRLRQLESERQSAQLRRDRHRERRDELRTRLRGVHERILQLYRAAESEFVPRFQALAHSFLGIDLQIAIEQRARGAELILVINGTRRRRTTQLSESQRYFVDIALRMALVEYLTGGAEATLLIDTPEGSLDISYEDRAGRMFWEFTSRGNRLFMTANLNSSRLVQRLAALSGTQGMHIERMTEWGLLSDVQVEAADLFQDTFDRIQAALHSGSVVL